MQPKTIRRQSQRQQRISHLTIFDILNHFILSVLAITMLYPMWYIIVATFMDASEYFTKTFLLFPLKPTLENLSYLLGQTDTLTYLGNTVIVTIIGTATGLFFTAMTAWGLAQKFPGAKICAALVLSTMFLHPGIIAEYVTYKALGIINSRTLLVLIYLIQPFYLIVMISNFAIFPKEVIEAAKIDGTSQFQAYFRIVLPSSKAILAAIGLFIAVQYWNMYLPSVFFISSNSKKTMQDFLATMITSEKMAGAAAEAMDKPPGEMLKMASISVAILPILVVYPFLQKHFVKGALLGAIKG